MMVRKNSHYKKRLVNLFINRLFYEFTNRLCYLFTNRLY